MDLKSWNYALLTKTLWNLQNKKDSLWAKWVNHVYWRGGSLWDASAKHEDSPLIKKLIEIKDKLMLQLGSKRLAESQLNQLAVDGKFQCLDAYNFWRSKASNVPWQKVIWKNSSEPKYSWLAAKGKLLTSDKFVGEETDKACGLCDAEIESLDHLFFKCNISSTVWNNIKGWLGLTRAMTTIKASLKWIHKEGKGSGIQAVGKKASLAITVYWLWHFRNKRRFEGIITHPDAIIKVIQTHIWRVVYEKFPSLCNLVGVGIPAPLSMLR
ncbi:uncharacterized protein LOC131145199 [Malania oleifera]|uniref:uncharacterized protein LOC131145199 n=1 Tax=Malania oleifera TaxID=397392 RepID=UPI0025AE0DB1|nr:uncharacterized protein LOC131145199 [Malania oleifera]